jgi:hypothetical protein
MLKVLGASAEKLTQAVYVRAHLKGNPHALASYPVRAGGRGSGHRRRILEVLRYLLDGFRSFDTIVESIA